MFGRPIGDDRPRRIHPCDLDERADAAGAAGDDSDKSNAEPDAAVTPGPELDCLRGVLAPSLLNAAARRAGELGIGADQVLIRWGIIDEARYLNHLAAHLDIAQEDFRARDCADTPLHDDQLRFAAASGLLPLWQNGQLIWAVSPRQTAARTLCGLLRREPELGRRVRLTREGALRQFLLHPGGALAREASSALHRRDPALSAAPHRDSGAGPALTRLSGVTLLVGLLLLFMATTWGALPALLFLSFTGLRLAAALQPRPTARDSTRLRDDELPIYTAVAALHREAESVGPLLQAIEALDYPPEKLDIIIVLEPHDLATRAAVARLEHRPHLRVLIAPPTAPQTKPKALNVALPFVRGSLVTVFDAEDRPEPGQLRAVLAAFADGTDIGCVQASLAIDNVTHDWLSRLFLAEYAGQFDAVLPGLTRFGMPLPLGGSSNHFRTAVLREVGGWDAYNVTEDADLGFRLARFGYRSVSIASSTNEEAPVGFAAWLPQRTRWMKGWMQTWCVHMRQPLRFWREAGWRGVLTLNLTVGGGVLSALMHPLLWLTLGWTAGSALAGHGKAAPAPAAWLYGMSIAAGYLGSAAVALIGLKRREKLRLGWWLLAMPAYWICLSIAAWRALWQLVRKPHHWEKTEHGRAKREAAAAGQPAWTSQKSMQWLQYW